jgi:hypothetical protein
MLPLHLLLLSDAPPAEAGPKHTTDLTGAIMLKRLYAKRRRRALLSRAQPDRQLTSPTLAEHLAEVSLASPPPRHEWSSKQAAAEATRRRNLRSALVRRRDAVNSRLLELARLAGGFYSVPAVKFTLQAASHIAFLALYGATLYLTPSWIQFICVDAVNISAHNHVSIPCPADHHPADVPKVRLWADLVFSTWAMAVFLDSRSRNAGLRQRGIAMTDPISRFADSGKAMLGWSLLLRWVPLALMPRLLACVPAAVRGLIEPQQLPRVASLHRGMSLQVRTSDGFGAWVDWSHRAVFCAYQVMISLFVVPVTIELGTQHSIA